MDIRSGSTATVSFGRMFPRMPLRLWVCDQPVLSGASLDMVVTRLGYEPQPIVPVEIPLRSIVAAVAR